MNNNYVNYYELSNEEYLNRTNNYLESFSGNLNDILQCYHPKISYLISKNKNYIVNVYEKIKCNLLKNNNPNIVEKFSLINDLLKIIIKNINLVWITTFYYNKVKMKMK